jgi:hypothetical protein
MLDNLSAKMDPQTVKRIKVVVIVGAVAVGAIVATGIAYKMGLFKSLEVFEEATETAAQTAA